MLAGPDGLVRLITECECDMVLNAIVGSAGLLPTVADARRGHRSRARQQGVPRGRRRTRDRSWPQATGAAIIPVDSEHSALHQLLAAERPGTVDRLILTASGGPFRGLKREDLEHGHDRAGARPPTWAMGGKITIDSATLMNKGLELIEAHHLFGTPYEQIDVVVHPQSIIHSLIQLCDGATLAHLGYPDMRVPISYALHHPERVDVPVTPLDLVVRRRADLRARRRGDVQLPARWPARPANAGGTAPCTLNAANEVAVHAFLGGRLRVPGHRRRDRGDARAAAVSSRCTRSTRSAKPTRQARRSPASSWKSAPRRKRSYRRHIQALPH